MSSDDLNSPPPPLSALIDLSGRNAVVTGGAMGIGRAIAARLHEAGANVFVADIAVDEAERAARELNELRDNSARAIQCDVSDQASVEALIAAAGSHLGGLDIFVNNAGIYPMQMLAELDLQTFQRTLDVNLTGLYLCTKLAAAAMVRQQRAGSIINVTSIDALHPSMVGLAHYDASKHGAWGFTKSAALEFAPQGIRVNAIAPGAIKTPGTGLIGQEEAVAAFTTMIPLGRMGEPDDIGRAALFLASELSAYMTGAQIVVDGGRLLR